MTVLPHIICLQRFSNRRLNYITIFFLFLVAIDHDFIAEYAKSSRSECKGCGKKIGKVISFSLMLEMLQTTKLLTKLQ